MRRVANLYPIIAEQLVDRLQAGSIPASATQNLDTSGYPVFPLHGLSTVWIPDDADVHEAMRITKAFIEALPPPSEEAAEVECPQCGEYVPGSFSSCWNCGAEMGGG